MPSSTNPRLEALRSGLRSVFDAPVLARLPATLPPRRGKVVVAGGGFAGLATAHFLVRLGYEVVVHEARSRVGGRVYTNPYFVDGAIIEFGAELIGDNHAVWLGFADAFGLGMREVSEASAAKRPLLLNGQRYGPGSVEPSTPVWDAMDKVQAFLTSKAELVTSPYRPWLTPDAHNLDGQSLGSFIDASMPAFPEPIRRPLRIAIEGELADNNVIATVRQSLLGNLALVSGGGGEDFWAKSETKRCADGNAALAGALATDITAHSEGRAQIRLGSAVRTIINEDGRVRVGTTTGSETCDYVVLAIPPTVWNDQQHDERVVVDGEPIPANYVMQVGPALKFFTELDGPFWGDELDPAGMAAKLAFAEDDWPRAEGETWEGTDAQHVPSGKAELSVFVGGPGAAEALTILGFGKEVLRQYYGAMLDVLYPGYAQHRLKTDVMAWPLEPWIRAGYSCPAPGQVTSVAPCFAQPFHERTFFAGEHTCPAFFGYMEGALESGLLATGLMIGAYEEVADALDAAAKVHV